MTVEVLYVAECPFHSAAVRLIKSILAAQGIAAEVREVLVQDQDMASQLEFCGSPTIRINGRDVAGESQMGSNFVLNCRFYPGSSQIGLPATEMIERSVMEALKEGTS